MWVIGMLVCTMLMLGGHAALKGHGTHSGHGAAAAPAAPAAPPSSATPRAVPEEAATGAALLDSSQPEPELGHHHD